MPVRGVKISEKRITPSGLKARHGWREISTCRGHWLLAALLCEILAGEGAGLDTVCWVFQAACEQCSVQSCSDSLVSCLRSAVHYSTLQCTQQQCSTLRL